ncbi:MAG: hypothetical protein PHR16_06690 [Methylovulum sp.]|nr:hypothetical protein [Methylovulum sp.]
MKFLKKSKLALTVAGFYLLLAMAVFAAHLYSVTTNPADSGESGIPFFMLTLPWIKLVPVSWYYTAAWSWLAYPVSWFCVALNTFIVYCTVGLAHSITAWAWKRFLASARNR